MKTREGVLETLDTQTVTALERVLLVACVLSSLPWWAVAALEAIAAGAVEVDRLSDALRLIIDPGYIRCGGTFPIALAAFMMTQSVFSRRRIDSVSGAIQNVTCFDDNCVEHKKGP